MTKVADTLEKTLAKLSHLDLKDRVQRDGTVMKAHGGYCDVFVGTLRLSSTPHGMTQSFVKVAIKRLRVHMQTDRDFERIVARELYIWSKLSHRNILPLRGFVMEEHYPCIVADWMENGTVVKFLNNNPFSDVHAIILGIARGVKYLHSMDIVHSDLKADNVLVGPEGQPLICDFGISRIFCSSITITDTTSGGMRGSMRWMAPELVALSSDGRHTKASDVWAFGMLVLEILTRKIPYAHLKNDAQVLMAIKDGILPPTPVDFENLSPSLSLTLSLWTISEVCWTFKREDRTTIDRIVDRLERESQSETGDMIDVMSSQCPPWPPVAPWEVASESRERYWPDYKGTQQIWECQSDRRPSGSSFALAVLPTTAPLLVVDSISMIYFDLRFPYSSAKQVAKDSRWAHSRYGVSELAWVHLSNDDLKQPACIPYRRCMQIVPQAPDCEDSIINIQQGARSYVTVEDVLMAINVTLRHSLCDETCERGFSPDSERSRSFNTHLDLMIQDQWLRKKYMFGGLSYVGNSMDEGVWKMRMIGTDEWYVNVKHHYPSFSWFHT